MTFAPSEAWLASCGLDRRGYRNWWVEMTIGAESGVETHLELRICPLEWWVAFRHGNQCSEIRFATTPHESPRDDHGIRGELADVGRFGSLLSLLERRYDIEFRRHSAEIRSNLPGAATIVRRWLVSV